MKLMKAITSLSLLLFAQWVSAHGDHDAPAPDESYAQRHMRSEHHIGDFDAGSFHRIHDLDGDGVWNVAEIEAIYGVHHISSKDDESSRQLKAKVVAVAVLKALDANADGTVSFEELVKAGLGALPNFDNMGIEGHHYDVESEFFLHHEEKYHSTPETQTDEAYNHPEDQEHFAMHDKIESEEAKREAKYQGITVEELMKNRALHPDAGEKDKKPDATAQESSQETPGQPIGVPVARHPHDEQVQVIPPVQEPPAPKITRVTPPEKQDPAVRYRDALKEANQEGAYGTGEAGFKRPKTPGGRMKGPYKKRMQSRFRRSWGDF